MAPTAVEMSVGVCLRPNPSAVGGGGGSDLARYRCLAWVLEIECGTLALDVAAFCNDVGVVSL